MSSVGVNKLNISDSMLYDSPRPRINRAILTKEYVDNIMAKTPLFSENSDKLFRNLRDQGLISYAEFLFLISIMTQPQSASTNSFGMIDRKYNNSLTKGLYTAFFTLN